MEKERRILIADMRSFYASVEQALDPRLKGKPIIVSGNPEHRSGIVLAASPEAKAWGVKTAMVTWEAIQACRQAILVRPKMAKYIEVSMQISEIAAKFTDSIEVYSIDELFMDVTNVEHLFGDAWTIARKFQDEVRRVCGIETCIGISYNKFMAKMVLDNYAKKTPDQIAEWKREDVATMHRLPVSDMFMVGSRMTRNFMRMGIRTIGQIARCDKQRLIKQWGIMGQVYHDLSWGRDDSPVNSNSYEGEKGIGHMITLAHDYEEQADIETVLLELTEEVCRRTRKGRRTARTVNVSCRSGEGGGSGFHRQLTLPEATNFTMDIYRGVCELFRTHWRGQPVRAVGVGVTNLEDDTAIQLSMFDDREKKRSLSYTMDRIREKYGTASLVRGSSLESAAVIYERADKIGGHWA